MFKVILFISLLALVSSHSLGLDGVSEKMDQTKDIKDSEEAQVIKKLIGFILKNSDCFPQDAMLEEIRSLFLGRGIRSEVYTPKPKAEKSGGYSNKHWMKRSEKDSKRRYKDDIGTILYIGKREED